MRTFLGPIALAIVMLFAFSVGGVDDALAQSSATMTCNANATGSTPTPETATLSFYPPPSSGAPDAQVYAGEGFSMSCGLSDRMLQGADPTKICPDRTTGFPQFYGLGSVPITFHFSVTGACWRLKGQSTVATLTHYPIVTWRCHAPLTRIAAANPVYYVAEHGVNTPYTNAMRVGECAIFTGSAPPAPVTFCAPTRLHDQPYVGQLTDLENGGFYQFDAHMLPGCGVYLRDTLRYLGQAQPSPTPSPNIFPTHVPVRTPPPAPLPTPVKTP